MNKIKLLLLAFIFSTQLFSATIPYDLKEQINSIPLNKNSYSIFIQSTSSSTPLVSWQAHKKRTPASVIKILTTYASLMRLGYDFRWKTRFYYTGTLRRGVLRGDLIVEAGGDPTLKTSDVDSIVNKLHNHGIKRITGNIILDRSIFRISSKNNSGFDKTVIAPTMLCQMH